MTTYDKIVRQYMSEFKLPIEDAKKIIDTIIDKMSDGLSTDNTVSINNLGTFEKCDRNIRLNRHPKTGKTISVVNNYTVRYRSSSKLLK